MGSSRKKLSQLNIQVWSLIYHFPFKLQGWKANLLSKIARIELINSTLMNQTNYMKPFILPIKIAKFVDKNMRNFFWGHDANTKKLHTLKWEEIAKPKISGGLVIRQAVHHNKAIFLSNLWKIQISHQNLLSCIFLSKYGPNFTRRKYSSSFIHRNIKRLAPTFNLCIRKVISDDKSTNFWYNNWLGKSTIRSQICGPLLLQDEDKKVSSVSPSNIWGVTGTSVNFLFNFPNL